MIDLSLLPGLNATLNTTSALLLILGYTLIRRRVITGHMLCMCAAFLTSSLFLVSYLYYHFYHGSTHFTGKGPVRLAYFFILITHTVLAVVIVPLILRTFYWALKSDFYRHVKIAKTTLALWLYVSVTGVVVYAMLYRMKF